MPHVVDRDTLGRSPGSMPAKPACRRPALTPRICSGLTLYSSRAICCSPIPRQPSLCRRLRSRPARCPIADVSEPAHPSARTSLTQVTAAGWERARLSSDIRKARVNGVVTLCVASDGQILRLWEDATATFWSVRMSAALLQCNPGNDVTFTIDGKRAGQPGGRNRLPVHLADGFIATTATPAAVLRLLAIVKRPLGAGAGPWDPRGIDCRAAGLVPVGGCGPAVEPSIGGTAGFNLVSEPGWRGL
jgi:hypothetical protein